MAALLAFKTLGRSQAAQTRLDTMDMLRARPSVEQAGCMCSTARPGSLGMLMTTSGMGCQHLRPSATKTTTWRPSNLLRQTTIDRQRMRRRSQISEEHAAEVVAEQKRRESLAGAQFLPQSGLLAGISKSTEAEDSITEQGAEDVTLSNLSVKLHLPGGLSGVVPEEGDQTTPNMLAAQMLEARMALFGSLCLLRA